MDKIKPILNRYSYSFISAAFATWAIFEKFVLAELQIPMLVTLLFSACFLLFYRVESHVKRLPLFTRIACALFAFFMVAGDSFKEYDSFFGLFGNPFYNTDVAEQLFEDFAGKFTFLNGILGNLIQVFSSLCKWIGYYFIIKHSAGLLFVLIRRVFLCNEENSARFSERFFAKKAFLRVFLVLVLAWLPYLIIKFPGTVVGDAQTQIKQFLAGTITTHHPYFTALLFGAFAKIGEWLGSYSFGLFLYLLFHYTFMAASFAYCIVSMQRLSKRSRTALFVLALFAFSPAFPSFATTVIKDALYCTFFVLFTVLLCEVVFAVKQGDGAWKKKSVFLVVISIFTCLVRNNGIYIVAPTLLLLLLWMLVRLKKRGGGRAYLALLLLPLLFYVGYDALQYDVLHLRSGSAAEMLSIPFQQTARFVKEHPEDVSKEDAQIIDRVLDFENLDELYNPIISDPVKRTYKEDASALGEYFGVWWKHLWMHPDTYIEATVNTNYFAFYPDEPNIRAYAVLGSWPDAQPIPILNALRMALLAFVMGLSAVPIVGCLINPVFYVWIFLWLLLRMFAKKEWSGLLLLLPLFIQLLTVIAGPAVFNHPRYIYPIYWSIPFLVMYFLPAKSSGTKPNQTL